MVNMYIGLQAKYRLFVSDFNETRISYQIFERYVTLPPRSRWKLRYSWLSRRK